MDLTILAGKQTRKKSSDNSSRISKHEMENIVERLMMQQHRSSTARTYIYQYGDNSIDLF